MATCAANLTFGVFLFSGTTTLVALRRTAQATTAAKGVRTLVGKTGDYKQLVGSYPTEDQGGLQALAVKPQANVAKKWVAQVTPEALKDPWGNDYKYDLIDDSETGQKVPHIWSMGPDGQDGTEDDITSWTQETK